MSSHREAPEISKDPVADSTDVYGFVSPDNPGTVTLIANYIPLQGPDGGPNFFEFGDDVLYSIHVDNNGDGVEDITYNFRFTTTLAPAASSFFLYNTGPMTSLPSPNWSRPQTFTLTEVRNGNATVLGTNLLVPPCNIGPLSTPNYPSLVAAALSHNRAATGLNVYAGQRAEGFYVDLGAVFDLGDLRPFEAAHAGSSLAAMPGVNSTDMLNVHSLAIQVPIRRLTRSGGTPSGVGDPNAVIGVWTSASRQKFRGIEAGRGASFNTGPFVQVSRLGNPLFNEVLIPLAKKDYWNAQPPRLDSQFASFVSSPGLAALLPSLYPGVFPNLAAYKKARADLAAILLTGIPAGIVPNFQTFTGKTQADMLRLNMAIPPTTSNPSSLGVLGGDLAGFPNGRRVFDDVATIELRAVAGATIPLVDSTFVPDAVVKAAPGAGGLQFGLVSGPNDITAMGTEKYLPTFPYLGTPHSGYNAHTPAALAG
ncbi:MAG: DUF4331 domain-containing protein [Acidimicrobiaceae bacterium]|nr:DUF4331 domain-containing protein [Acidimicrobiaceae bacterium]